MLDYVNILNSVKMDQQKLHLTKFMLNTLLSLRHFILEAFFVIINM